MGDIFALLSDQRLAVVKGHAPAAFDVSNVSVVVGRVLNGHGQLAYVAPLSNNINTADVILEAL